VTNYVEPAIQPRITNAPTSEIIPGDHILRTTWQQSILTFDVVTDVETSEADSRSLLADLRQALAQYRYTATVTVNDAPAETWRCQPGSVAPQGGRSVVDLENYNPVWSVVIPVHPIRTIEVEV
jgi:hypothetical protein